MSLRLTTVTSALVTAANSVDEEGMPRMKLNRAIMNEDDEMTTENFRVTQRLLLRGAPHLWTKI